MSVEMNGSNKDAKKLNLLLVEDNEADLKITLRAFEKGKLKNNVFIVTDGQQAVDFVKNREEYGDKEKYPQPDLILLDIKLPKIGGIEVLKFIKRDPACRHIPVIMLTSSKDQGDVIECYRNGAAGYIQKSVAFEDFVNIVDGFNYYWHHANRLPQVRPEF